jgi:acetyl-CoA carboxylase biotin carboxylase subunit
MDRALSEFRAGGPGIVTTVTFLREVLDHPMFREARHTTALLDHMAAERGAA